MVGEPGLAAFDVASDCVAEEIALVGRALPLDGLVVKEIAVGSGIADRVGGDTFDAKIEMIEGDTTRWSQADGRSPSIAASSR